MEAVRSWPVGQEGKAFQPLTLNLFIKLGTFSADVPLKLSKFT